MKRVTAAAQKKTPYKCSVESYDWFIHSVESRVQGIVLYGLLSLVYGIFHIGLQWS